MADKKSILVLRLEGSLQSWGEDAKWDFRDSEAFPTKSGIVGLLGCAMGIERGSHELKEISDAIRIAVRADRPGQRFIDFQTVTGAPLMAAAGKPKSGGNTIISSRAYLQDACFTVFIDADSQLQIEIAQALQNPRWCLFLGRKNCVPSRPILECISADYADLMDAVMHYPSAQRADYPMLFETEEPMTENAGMMRQDSIADEYRSFGLRCVWRGVGKEKENVPDTD